MKQYLVCTAIGPDSLGIIKEIGKLVQQYSCNIVDSRMSVLGSEFTMLMLLEGSWDAVAKIENNFPTLAKQLGLELNMRRTERAKFKENLLPYSIQVTALNNPGIVYEVTNFFAEQDITINHIYTETYTTRDTGVTIFSLLMTVNIPADLHLADLRENFLVFCDARNLDAIIEPEKN